MKSIKLVENYHDLYKLLKYYNNNESIPLKSCWQIFYLTNIQDAKKVILPITRIHYLPSQTRIIFRIQ